MGVCVVVYIHTKTNQKPVKTFTGTLAGCETSSQAAHLSAIFLSERFSFTAEGVYHFQVNGQLRQLCCDHTGVRSYDTTCFQILWSAFELAHMPSPWYISRHPSKLTGTTRCGVYLAQVLPEVHQFRPLWYLVQRVAGSDCVRSSVHLLWKSV